ncbi:hypothetical protein [Kozakia baliensis]|uniref:hypothetical protein n=1 Tax=Kozakia baliensis TaxID=153496 RepID=UPI0011BD57E5|nr:hypothetical protein [Kozakia baliensis]
MDPVEERLYGLLEVIEQQQVAVQRALEGLQAERAAMAQERAALAGEVQRLTPLLRQAVEMTVTDHMRVMTGPGTQALQDAVTPLLGAVGQAARKAGEAEKALETMADQATRKVVLSWAGWGALIVLVGWGFHEILFLDGARSIERQRATKAELTEEIVRMQANLDTWTQAGMLEKITHCQPENRLCIRVDERAGAFGEDRDYRVIKGY